MASDRPELDLDLFSEDAIRNPHPLYRAIRDCAPAVWLPAHGVWAIGRLRGRARGVARGLDPRLGPRRRRSTIS